MDRRRLVLLDFMVDNGGEATITVSSVGVLGELEALCLLPLGTRR